MGWCKSSFQMVWLRWESGCGDGQCGGWTGEALGLGLVWLCSLGEGVGNLDPVRISVVRCRSFLCRSQRHSCGRQALSDL